MTVTDEFDEVLVPELANVGLVTPPKKEILTPTSFAGLTVSRAGLTRRHINMLIHGEAGVGKTWLAGSSYEVPAMREVLYVDAEAGADTIKASWSEVQLLATTKWHDYDAIYHALLAGGHPYQTCVLDSMSEILEHCKEQVMIEMKADPDNVERSEDIPGIREWGIILSRMMKLVRRYRDLPMNVIFIAHSEPTKLKNGKQKWMPLVNGKFQMKLPQVPDVVLWMFVQEIEGEQKRLLLTQQSDTAVAKVRGVDMPRHVGLTEQVRMATLMSYYER